MDECTPASLYLLQHVEIQSSLGLTIYFTESLSVVLQAQIKFKHFFGIFSDRLCTSQPTSQISKTFIISVKLLQCITVHQIVTYHELLNWFTFWTEIICSTTEVLLTTSVPHCSHCRKPPIQMAIKRAPCSLAELPPHSILIGQWSVCKDWLVTLLDLDTELEKVANTGCGTFLEYPEHFD